MSKLEFEIKKENLEPIVEFHGKFVDEIMLEFGNNGVVVVSVDPAHVVINRTEIFNTDFEFYENYQEETRIGIDVSKLKNILKLEPKGETFTFDYNPEDETHLVVKHGNLTHKIGLIDTDGFNLPTTPQISYDAKATIPVKDVQTAIKGIKETDDVIIINYTDKGIEIYNNPDPDSNNDPVKAMIPGDTKVKDPVTTMFSLDYFENVINIHKKFSDTIVIHNSTNFPVKIESFNGNNSFYSVLAPRIENNGDQDQAPEIKWKGFNFKKWDYKQIRNVKEIDVKGPVQNINLNGINISFKNSKINISLHGQKRDINISSNGDMRIRKNNKLIYMKNGNDEIKK